MTQKRSFVKTKVTGSLAAMMLLLMPFTAQHEGLKLKAYLDTGGVATICHGETEGVKMGDTATESQCKERLTIKLGIFGMLVWNAVGRDDMPNEVWAAATDLAYNVGWGAFKKSTLLKKLKAGDYYGACHQFERWKFVAGKDCNLKEANCPGIILRRIDETELCLKGLQNGPLLELHD